MKDRSATVIVDVSRPEEEILRDLDKDARWGIRKAQRAGLKVEMSSYESDWNDFYDIYKKTMSHAGTKIETLKHLKDHAKVLFVCKKDEKIVAGSTLDIIEGKTYLSRNASLDEFKNLQPNNLLYWHCILWSKQEGFDKFDLGGWQINANGQEMGVNKFKERWGKIVFYEKDYPPLKAIGRKLIRQFPSLRKLNKKIKSKK